jgi:hypothetical protein
MSRTKESSMKTTIPVNTFVAMMRSGELCHFRIVPLLQYYIDQHPRQDPQNKYAIEYVDKKDIPSGATVCRAKWRGLDEIVACMKKG